MSAGFAQAEEVTAESKSKSSVFRTAELNSSNANVSIEPVRRGRYYRSYGPSYRRYSYYPRYSYRPYGYSYRYPSYGYYGYSYPSYTYGYSRYGYGYPRYYGGYRGYGYPGYYGGGGVYIGRGGISIGW